MFVFSKRSVITNAIAFACFCLLFFSSVLFSVDVNRITNTPADDRNHVTAVRDNSIYLAWEAENNIFFAKSNNLGSNWSEPILVAEGLQPSITVGKDNIVYIAWHTTLNDTVYSIYSNNDGDSFDQSHLKLLGRGNKPVVSIDVSGQIHFVWIQSPKELKAPPTPYETYILYSRSPHPDSNIVFQTEVDSAYFTAQSLDFVLDPEAQNIYVTWSGPSTHYRLVNLSVSRDGGVSFVDIPNPTGQGLHGEFSPDLAFFSNDDIYLVWERDLGNEYNVYFRKFEKRAQKYGPTIKLNEISNYRGSSCPVFYPSIGLDPDNNIFAIWTGAEITSIQCDSTFIFLDMSFNNGISFAEDIRLDIDNNLHLSSKKNASVIFCDGSNLALLWEDDLMWGNEKHDIYFANIDLETGAIINEKILFPEVFHLYQNYPNPFNSATKINFLIPEASKVVLEIYNTKGEYIVELLNKELPAGQHTVHWQAAAIPSGVYLYKIKAGGFTETRKLILIR